MIQKNAFILYFALLCTPISGFFKLQEVKKENIRLAHIHMFIHAGQKITKTTFYSGKYNGLLATEIFGANEDNFTVQNLTQPSNQTDITLDLKTEIYRLKHLVSQKLKDSGFDSSKECFIIGDIMEKDTVIISYPIRAQE